MKKANVFFLEVFGGIKLPAWNGERKPFKEFRHRIDLVCWKTLLKADLWETQFQFLEQDVCRHFCWKEMDSDK